MNQFTLIRYNCVSNQFNMKIFSLIFSLTLAFSAFAQEDHLTPENLWKLERVYGEEVSPDGKSVMYLQKKYDLTANKGYAEIYTVSINGGEPKRISESNTPIFEAHWRPDGKKIGYTTSKSGSAQLWEMNPDGTDAEQVSSFDFDLENWKYAPDMKHLSF